MAEAFTVMAEAFTMDLVGCARCHGDGHPGLRFEPLTFPVEMGLPGAAVMTHWAPCPTNGEPILFGTTKGKT